MTQKKSTNTVEIRSANANIKHNAMNLLQIFSKKKSLKNTPPKEIYFIRDNNNTMIGTTNIDIIVAKIVSMGKNDVLMIERITEKEYRDRVLLEHHYDVHGAPVL